MTFLDRGARNWCRYVPAAVALWAIASANAAGPGSPAGFSAILGGAGQDYAAAVATDPQGNVYVAGLTYSPDFPVTPGALQTKIGAVGTSDAFVAKLAPDGTLLWSTFLGGTGDDWATGVGVDAAGNVLVTGWTRSANFPVFHASGAPVVVTAPTVLVGGVAAQVVSTVLTTGCAGLYQVTIRIPEAAPAGAVAVQATVGGVRTADGAMIFVGR